MEELTQIRAEKAKAYQKLLSCESSLKKFFENVYNMLDQKETILMEFLDLEED